MPSDDRTRPSTKEWRENCDRLGWVELRRYCPRCGMLPAWCTCLEGIPGLQVMTTGEIAEIMEREHDANVDFVAKRCEMLCAPPDLVGEAFGEEVAERMTSAACPPAVRPDAPRSGANGALLPEAGATSEGQR